MKRLLLFTALLLISCKTPKNISETDSNLTLLLQDDYFPVSEQQFHILRSEKELHLFFRRVNKTRKPGLPVPKVNFSENHVLVLCSGKTIGARDVEMKIEEENDTEITMASVSKIIAERTNEVTYPVYFYEIKKTEKNITFLQ